MIEGTRPQRARIVYDEELRGWLIELGPEPLRALFTDQRVIESASEAEGLLEGRGYSLLPADDEDWPWQRDREGGDPGHRPCVEDWGHAGSRTVLPFPGEQG